MIALSAAMFGVLAGLALFVVCYWMVEELEFEGDIDADTGPQPPALPDFSEIKQLIRGDMMWAVVFMFCGGIAAATMSMRFGIDLRGLCGLIFCFALISLTFIDRRTSTLPDVTTLPTLWLGLGMQLVPGTATIGVEKALAACILAYMIAGIPSFLYELLRGRSVLGGGDLKMLAMIGAWMGLSAAFNVLFIAALLLVLVQLIRGGLRHHLHDSYAFGPYLGAAAFVLYLTEPMVF